jgi:hypothetical protein
MDNEETQEVTRSFSELQDELARWQRKANELEESATYRQQRQEQLRKTIAERDNRNLLVSSLRMRSLEMALSHYAGNLPKYDSTHPDIALLAQGALKVARLRGNFGDGLRALEELPEEVTQWREIRDNDAIITGMETSEDKEQRITGIVSETLRQLEHHPRDPRFYDVWRAVTVKASNENLCEEFDKLAELFDIPTDYELNYEGEVEREGYWSHTQDVEGTTTRAEITGGYNEDDFDMSEVDYETNEENRRIRYS